MSAAVEAIEAEHGAIGALVNNAGYSQSGAVESVPMDDVRRQFETNVFGLVRMCQLVLPKMRERRAGRIVNMSSMGANFVFPGGGLYHATKYAVDAISDALRFEVKGFGVDVVIIQPGRSGPSSARPPTTGSASRARVRTRELQRRGRQGDDGGLREGSDEDPRRRPRRGGQGRRAGDHREAAQGPLPRHAQRAPAHQPAQADDDGMWDRFVGTQFPRPGES